MKTNSFRRAVIALFAIACLPSLLVLSSGSVGATPTLSAGTNHSCAIIAGKAQCWGRNQFGQLGRGSLQDSARADQVPLDSAEAPTAISASHGHACAAVAGGVQCWGLNTFGQLGNGSVSDSALAVWVQGLPAGSGVQSVAAGAMHTCAIVQPAGAASGGVMCWGRNDHAQLGVSTATAPLRNFAEWVPGLGADSDVVSLAVGASHSCAVVGGSPNGGAVKCWGGNVYSQRGDNNGTDRAAPATVVGMDIGAIAVTAGDNHTCTIVLAQFGPNSGIRCWGYDLYGQLGRGNNAQPLYVPVPVVGLEPGGAQHVVDLSAGGNHACAALANGSVRCWGQNSEGQLGQTSTGPDDRRDQPAAAVTGITSATAVAAGGHHTCAKVAEGLKCWGQDLFGELGRGADQRVRSPLAINNTGGAAQVDAGLAHTCAVVNNTVRCWGLNNFGQLGEAAFYGVSFSTPIPPDGLGSNVSVTAVTAGAFHSCAVVALGQQDKGVCWGLASDGQHGAGNSGDFAHGDWHQPMDSLNGAIRIASMSAGDFHTCAITGPNNSVNGLRCAGFGTSGQLGKIPFQSQTAFDYATGFAPDPSVEITSLAIGANHGCAIVDDNFGDGQLYCWGKNDYGQVGNGSKLNQGVPVQIFSSGVFSVAAGARHTCAVMTDGSVKCWGDNRSGQLGLGDPSMLEALQPTTLPALQAGTFNRRIAAGDAHTCVSTLFSAMRCWGDNTYGQLGDGTVTSRSAPVDYFTFNSISSLTAGKEHTCISYGTGASGNVACWGSTLYGRVGNGQFGMITTSSSLVQFSELFRNGFE